MSTRRNSRTGSAKSIRVEVLKPDFTEEEWLAVAPAFDNSKGLTAEEIGQNMGRAAPWVRTKILKPGLLSGKVTPGKRLIQRIDGRDMVVPVYSLTAG